MIILGKGHDPLGYINAVTNCIAVAIDVLDDFYRSKVNTQIDFLDVFFTRVLQIDKCVSQPNANKENLLGITQVANRNPITSVQLDAIILGDITQGIGDQGTEMLLNLHLIGNG